VLLMFVVDDGVCVLDVDVDDGVYVDVMVRVLTLLLFVVDDGVYVC